MTTFVVTTRADVVDATDGVISLREAIDAAQGQEGADRIEFDTNIFIADGPGAQRAVRLEAGELVIDGGGGPLIIDGDLDDDGRADVVIDAQQASRVIDATAELLLEGLVITGGLVVGDGTVEGGGILAGELTLRDCLVSRNFVEGDLALGGGIFADSVTVIDSRITGNSAVNGFIGESQGGGIHAGTVILTRSVVVRNEAYAYVGEAFGGGIHAESLLMTDSVLRRNSSVGYDVSGGGFYAATVSMADSVLRRNFLDGYGDAHGGGGVAAAADITGTIIVRNNAFGRRGDTSGGGLSIGTGRVIDSVIADNRDAGGYYGGGGGISAGTITIEGTRISGNSTSADYSCVGGGVSAASLTLLDSKVAGNSAATRFMNNYGGFDAEGGGIFAFYVAAISGSVIADNSAVGLGARGGGVRAGTLTIAASTISGNIANDGSDTESSGGGASADTAQLTNVTLSGNRTSGTGGGLAADSSTLLHTTITGNSAAIAGGVSGTIVARNSLILGNAANNTATADTGGAAPTLRNTLLGGDASLVFAETVEITAGGNSVLAGVLADNGGTTRTVALLDDATNPALNTGGPAFATATDQRGVPRETPPDLGAFELADAAPVATDNAFRVVEDGPARSRNLIRNDLDADAGAGDPGLAVFAVNGVATDVGVPIVIGAGLVVVVDADGQFSFDPNDAYEFLARGELATERFTYSVEDADGLTDVGEVVITIAGREDLILFG